MAITQTGNIRYLGYLRSSMDLKIYFHYTENENFFCLFDVVSMKLLLAHYSEDNNYYLKKKHFLN